MLAYPHLSCVSERASPADPSRESMQVRVQQKTPQMPPMDTDSTRILQKPEHTSVFTITGDKELNWMQSFLPNMISICVCHPHKDRKVFPLKFNFILMTFLLVKYWKSCAKFMTCLFYILIKACSCGQNYLTITFKIKTGFVNSCMKQKYLWLHSTVLILLERSGDT